jgi:hypothetical protein
MEDKMQLLKQVITASSLILLASCGDPATESLGEVEQHLCPDGPCVEPKEPKDPPPTGWYPAAGWNVITASESALERGVEWWAYQWQGNTLAVKGYYPGNFGTGITVGQEPAHVFIDFNVASLTNWTADVTLVYQTRYNGVLYPKGHIETSINADGVVSRYMRVPPPYTENGDIATTVNDINEGWYEDDGTGPRIVWGADISLRPASQAILMFLTDFHNAGGVLLNPDAMSSCDEGCTSGFQNYLWRKGNALAALTSPGDPAVSCITGGVLTAVCGAGGAWVAGLAILVAAFGPASPAAAAVVAGICVSAGIEDLHCGVEVVQESIRQQGGPCVNSVMITGPVTGPDGRPYEGSHMIIDVYRCPF